MTVCNKLVSELIVSNRSSQFLRVSWLVWKPVAWAIHIWACFSSSCLFIV